MFFAVSFLYLFFFAAVKTRAAEEPAGAGWMGGRGGRVQMVGSLWVTGHRKLKWEYKGKYVLVMLSYPYMEKPQILKEIIYDNFPGE